MELTTPRLRLRDFQSADWQAVHTFTADPAVVQFMPLDPATQEEVHAWVQAWIDQAQAEPRTSYDLAVVHATTQRVIGWCRIAWRSDEVRQAELAYMLHQQYWGQGVATELAHALLTFGFTTMQAHRIFATTRPANVGSWRVLEKLGMRREGHLRQHRWMKGTWHDSFLYAILDDAWADGEHGT